MAEQPPESIKAWNEFIKHAGAIRGDADGGTVACFIVEMLSKRLDAVEARLKTIEDSLNPNNKR